MTGGVDGTGRRRRVLLASRSPRRRELLRAAGFEVIVRPGDVDEEVVAAAHRDEGPAAVAAAVAAAKAAAAVTVVGPGPVPVLAADTVVWAGERPVGPPADREAAVETLVGLSGAEITVATGVVLVDPGGPRAVSRTSTVTLTPLTRAAAVAYVATGAADGTAGGLELQDRAAHLVAATSGCWTNVVGLPMCGVAALFGDGAGAWPLRCRSRDGSPCPDLDAGGVRPLGPDSATLGS